MYYRFKRILRNKSITMFRRYFDCTTLTLCWILFVFFVLFKALTNYDINDYEKDVHIRSSDAVNIISEDENLTLPAQLNEIVTSTDSSLNPFQSSLMTHAENDVIMVCIVDINNLYFALNVYESSIRKLNIFNYMFITTTSKISLEMQKRKLNYFALFNDDEKPPLDPQSKEYERQTITYKRKVVSEALKVHLRPLVFDPTMHLFRNPLPDLLSIVNENKHDIIAYPAGLLTFALFLPTNNCAEMYRYIDNYKHLVPNDTDDGVINTYLQWMLKRDDQPLRIHTLDMMRYVSGEKYFILGQ